LYPFSFLAAPVFQFFKQRFELFTSAFKNRLCFRLVFWRDMVGHTVGCLGFKPAAAKVKPGEENSRKINVCIRLVF
jgi:hypothetical protein